METKTCGYIMSSSPDFDNFLMRCSQCTTDVEIDKWQEFVLHVRNAHGSPAPQKEDSCLQIEEIVIAESFINEEVLNASTQGEEQQLQSEPEISRPCSSMSETSLSENESIGTMSESYAQSVEEAEQDTQEQAMSGLTYRFNPSFFRRDPRTLKFIESYKSHPCLWNPDVSKYKDPSACKAAYQQLIRELESKINVLFSEYTLRAAIKKLHIQYTTVEKRVMNGSQKPNSIAFTHYRSCSFLKECKDQTNSDRINIMKLDFTKRNKPTSDFIRLYANFPQLYDNKHKNFSSMACRKQAYEQMTAEARVHHADVSTDDIYLAIQFLRQWFYKSTKHAIKATNESEEYYLKTCSFLPPKMFKLKLICEICQQETSSDHVLQAHMYKTHNIGELPFKCTVCDRSFTGRGDLATHMQRVHIGKTHKCQYCERTFAVNSDLRLHMRTHTGNNILCELCGKAFRLRSQLKLHVTAIHTKIRAFKCTMCPKDFIKKVDLSDHIKSHLNIRDKICATCGKGFTSCHSLIRHGQIHSEVKKFACKLCNARFSQFVGLNSHMKRTHNIIRSNVQKQAETVITEQSIS